MLAYQEDYNMDGRNTSLFLLTKFVFSCIHEYKE